MAALSASTTERPHIGDIRFQVFKFAAVANGDTFAVPGATRVLGAVTISTASGQVSWTVAGTNLTAVVSAGTPAVTLCVLVA